MLLTSLLLLATRTLAFSNGAPYICDPMTPLFGCFENSTGVLLPSKGSSTPANKVCKADGQIMWWVAGATRSDDYTLRSGNTADPSQDTTAYVPSSFMHIYVKVLAAGKKYGGLLLHAINAQGVVVGEFNIPAKNNHPFWTPNNCPGAVLHATGNLKPYLAEMLYQTPPAGTGTITFQALIKRGEANTGEFYHPQSDLVLTEEVFSTSMWNMTRPGESCDQFCTLRYRNVENIYECDSKAMALQSKTASTLSSSMKGKFPLFEPIVSDCGKIAPAVREEDDMSFYHDDTCVSTEPSCTAYANGIRRFCLCKKRPTKTKRTLEHVDDDPNRAPAQRSGAPRVWKCNTTSLLVLLIVVLVLLPEATFGHNWVETPSRARSRASTTRPCQSRKASDLHAQIGKTQDHVVKFAAGHASTSYWAIVAGANETWLSHPDFKTMLLDYIDQAPESVNTAFEGKWKRYHATDSTSCDTTTNDAACLKPFMDMTDPAKVHLSTIVPNRNWCDKNDLTTCSLFSRRVPSTDANFLDHPLEPTEFTRNGQKRGALFEYRDASIRAAKDKRVMYKNEKYPWLIGAHKYMHLASMPSTVDTFRVGLPSYAPAGHYVINWWWAGYYDAIDFDYVPSVDAVENVYGLPQCSSDSSPNTVCSTANPLKPCCRDSLGTNCGGNTRNNCKASPAIFNKIDHCQYAEPSLFVTQAKVLKNSDDVQECLDELQNDWWSAGSIAPLGRAGVVVSPLALPGNVFVKDALLEEALRNTTAMMKHQNAVAPLPGIKDELSMVHWNSWFASGVASTVSGNTCASFLWNSQSASSYHLGTLRDAVLKCSDHQCRGVVWKPRAGETNPGLMYDTHPDPPLQFQFCGEGGLVSNADGSTAIVKESVANWKDNIVTTEPIHRINFMPKDSSLDLPTDVVWMKDVGEAFGDRGGGWKYGWNADVSSNATLGDVDPACTKGSCKNIRDTHTYLVNAKWVGRTTFLGTYRDRVGRPSSSRAGDVFNYDIGPESVDTTMFLFRYYQGERVPRRALDPTYKPNSYDYSVDRPPLKWSVKVPNGVYNVSIMVAWDMFFSTSSMSRSMSGGCTVEQTKIDYDGLWESRSPYNSPKNIKFSTAGSPHDDPSIRDEAERKYHIRNVVVVVKDGTLDVSTVAVNILTDRDTIKFNAIPRCHSISWIQFQKIANYPTVSDGGYPSAWFPSITKPWFQRDFGTKKEVRVVRLTPPAAPWRNAAEVPFMANNWRNSPHMYYSGRGRDNQNPTETCRSRWLVDGDSCVDDSQRGRELGNWDHSPENYGYTVTVGDVACDSEPCPADPNATVCRPLPGLTEWSLGNGEYKGKGTLLREQKIHRPQTPPRPEDATWSILQLSYYLPFTEGGQADIRRLQPLLHDCGDATGRYVRVQLHGNRRIFDAKVDVVGTEVQLPEGVTDPENAKLCYGVMAREARSLPTPLMEYEVSEDPNDPVFYSTCYVRELKRLWVKHDWHEELVITGDFRLETTCLSCPSYDASITRQNDTYVPDWTLDHTCHNCDAVDSTLSYLEHDPIAVRGGPNDIAGDGNGTNLAPSMDGDDQNFLGLGVSKETFIGIAVGGGLLIIVLSVVLVVFVVKNRSERASHRNGSIQLSNTARVSNTQRGNKFYGSNSELALLDEKRMLFDAYTTKRRESGALRPTSMEPGRKSSASREQALDGTVDDRSTWEQHIDEINEIYYYYNIQTCESVWDPPATFQLCEWQIEVDESSGDVFYSNENLGKTSWSVTDTQDGFKMKNPMM